MTWLNLLSSFLDQLGSTLNFAADEILAGPARVIAHVLELAVARLAPARVPAQGLVDLRHFGSPPFGDRLLVIGFRLSAFSFRLSAFGFRHSVLGTHYFPL